MEFLNFAVSFWIFPLKVIFWIAVIIVPAIVAAALAEEYEETRRRGKEPDAFVRNAPLIFGYIVIHYVVLILIGLPWLFYNLKVS